MALGWDCGNRLGSSRAQGGRSGVSERSESGLVRSTPSERLPRLQQAATMDLARSASAFHARHGTCRVEGLTGVERRGRSSQSGTLSPARFSIEIYRPLGGTRLLIGQIYS